MALSASWESQKTSGKAGGLILRTAQSGLCFRATQNGYMLNIVS
jgi:hypothetical protein